MTTSEFIKWVVENAIVPFGAALGAAFGGAYFAYRFSLKQREKETKTKARIRLQLIKNDIDKGQSALESVLKLWATKKYVFIGMPITYFKDLDFVELGNYVSDNCIENIRNIYENVFLVWNRRIDEALDMIKEGIATAKLHSFIEENFIARLVDPKPGGNYIKACSKVIGVIDEELGKLT